MSGKGKRLWEFFKNKGKEYYAMKPLYFDFGKILCKILDEAHSSGSVLPLIVFELFYNLQVVEK